MKFDEKDVRFDIYTTGRNIPVYMTVTHIPTRILLRSSGNSEWKIRSELLRQLQIKVESVPNGSS